jgi:hypothetical protein
VVDGFDGSSLLSRVKAAGLANARRLRGLLWPTVQTAAAAGLASHPLSAHARRHAGTPRRALGARLFVCDFCWIYSRNRTHSGYKA